MKAIHFICRKEGFTFRNMSIGNKIDPRHSFEIVAGEAVSGYWDVAESDAAELVGGFLFLHSSKADKAGFIGKITDYQPVVIEDKGHSDRIAFQVKIINSKGYNIPWSSEGAKHALAHSSGVVPMFVNDKTAQLIEEATKL